MNSTDLHFVRHPASVGGMRDAADTLTGTYPWPQVCAPVVPVPWTSNTGGEDAEGLPFGQVRAAASVAALTVKGASPGYVKAGLLLLVRGEANERTLKQSNSTERIDMAERKESGCCSKERKGYAGTRAYTAGVRASYEIRNVKCKCLEGSLHLGFLTRR